VGVVVLVSVLAVLMASTFGAFEIRLPSGVMGKLGARRGYLGAIFMGIVMGVIAAPCVGPFLLALIALVAKTGSVPLGAVSFFATGIGLGLPYVFLGIFTSLINRFPRGGGWLAWTKRLLGMSLAGLILWFANPYIDGAFFRPLALGVFLFAAVYMGILEGWSRRPFSKRFWTVRIAAAVLILAAGGAYGYVTADRPEVEWEPWTPGALEQAKAEGRPVLLYFGADWCFPCKVWHYGIFRDPGVVRSSEGFRRIRVDLTRLEEGPMKDFARRFNSVNPPGVFILGRDGRTIASFRDPPSAEQFLGAVRNAVTGGQEAGG
jgi:thiol:disulfide interchange protein DsbD